MSIRDDLKAYLDGELPLARMDEVRAAIERDPELARELAELRSVSSVLRASYDPPPAIGLEGTLTALRRRRRSPWMTWPLGMAAACLAAGIVVLLAPKRPSAAAVTGTVAMNPPDLGTAPNAPTVFSRQEARAFAPGPTSVPAKNAVVAPREALGVPEGVTVSKSVPDTPRAGERAAAKAIARSARSLRLPLPATSNSVVRLRPPQVPAGQGSAPRVAAAVPPLSVAAKSASAAAVPRTEPATTSNGFRAAPDSVVVSVTSMVDAEARLRAASISFTEVKSGPAEIEIELPETEIANAVRAAQGTGNAASLRPSAGQAAGGFGGGGGGFGGGSFAAGRAARGRNGNGGTSTGAVLSPTTQQGGALSAGNVPQTKAATPQSQGVVHPGPAGTVPAPNGQAADIAPPQTFGLSANARSIAKAPSSRAERNQAASGQARNFYANPLKAPTPPTRRITLILRQKPPPGKLEP